MTDMRLNSFEKIQVDMRNMVRSHPSDATTTLSGFSSGGLVETERLARLLLEAGV